MYCQKCGKENPDDSVYCLYCGANLKDISLGGGADETVGPIGILFFCIPISGAIAYFIWKDEKPVKAKKACYLALWGMGVGIVIQIISAIVENM